MRKVEHMCKKCCIPSHCGYASGSWRLHASYEANSEVEQWSRNVPAHVRVNRSLRGKRGDRTRVTVPATVPTRLFSARVNSMASDAGCSPAATLMRHDDVRDAGRSLFARILADVFIFADCRCSRWIGIAHRKYQDYVTFYFTNHQWGLIHKVDSDLVISEIDLSRYVRLQLTLSGDYQLRCTLPLLLNLEWKCEKGLFICSTQSKKINCE